MARHDSSSPLSTGPEEPAPASEVAVGSVVSALPPPFSSSSPQAARSSSDTASTTVARSSRRGRRGRRGQRARVVDPGGVVAHLERGVDRKLGGVREAGRLDRDLHQPCVLLSLASRKSRLRKQTKKKPTIAQTTAHVGMSCVVRDMSVNVQVTVAIGCVPDVA